jgi:hypothetical protein
MLLEIEAETVPSRQGHRESSPAIYCWVNDKNCDSVPQGTIETFTYGLPCDFTSASHHRSSLSGRARFLNLYPAMNCWATFIGSLRDRLLQRFLLFGTCAIPIANPHVDAHARQRFNIVLRYYTTKVLYSISTISLLANPPFYTHAEL